MEIQFLAWNRNIKCGVKSVNGIPTSPFDN